MHGFPTWPICREGVSARLTYICMTKASTDSPDGRSVAEPDVTNRGDKMTWRAKWPLELSFFLVSQWHDRFLNVCSQFVYFFFVFAQYFLSTLFLRVLTQTTAFVSGKDFNMWANYVPTINRFILTDQQISLHYKGCWAEKYYENLDRRISILYSNCYKNFL